MTLSSKVDAQTPSRPAKPTYPRMADYTSESDTAGGLRSIMRVMAPVTIVLGTVAALSLGMLGYVGYQKFFGQSGKSIQKPQPTVTAPGR